MTETRLAPSDIGGRSARWIESLQTETGMIPWSTGGHADPWNHVEAAMALTASGALASAERAYGWLAATQAPDGGLAAYFRADGTVEAARRDTNAIAYMACGVYHHALARDDGGVFARRMYPVVEAALDYVLGFERDDGGFAWSVEPDGTPADLALLAASSSIHQSLCSAEALAGLLGADGRRFAHARARVRQAIVERPSAFADKSVFAMDWYYPVLAGVLDGEDGSARLRQGWREFVEPGRGVRCRSDGRWVTAAETAECAIACVRCGEPERARSLLGGLGDLCGARGEVLTGRVHPEGVSFPRGEVTTYSAAALILAGAVLAGDEATRAVFSC